MKHRIKSWFINKEVIDSIADEKAAKQIDELERRHLVTMNRLRTKHIKAQDDLEKEFKAENERTKKELINEYEIKIKLLKEENAILIEKVRFAQSFWRNHISNADEVMNIAAMLESKARLTLNNKKEERDREIQSNTKNLKGILVEKEKLDKMFINISKNEKDSDKLLHLLDEE